jgi:hypothetical protein
MAQQTDGETTTETEEESTVTPKDVLGKRIFNDARHIGYGVAVDIKTVANRRGDSKRVFVCDSGQHTESRPGHSRFVNREVEDMMQQIQSDSYSTDIFDIGELFDDATRDNYDL